MFVSILCDTVCDRVILNPDSPLPSSESLLRLSPRRRPTAGKGSTWEGGIREPAFAYWPGQIPAGSRSASVVSSLDVVPTALELAGLAAVPHAPAPALDGRSMLPVLLGDAPSAHETLFFYASNMCRDGPTAARAGAYKAHWVTAPGPGAKAGKREVHAPPLLFNVDQDPSEAYPLDPQAHTALLRAFEEAYRKEKAAMVWARPPPDPRPDPFDHGVCCDWSRRCVCTP